MDKMTLDDLVRGDSTPQSWAELVADPEGAEAWRLARERRRAIDHRAGLVRRHPWLAGPWRELRRAGRRLNALDRAPLPLTLTQPGVALASEDATSPEQRREIAMRWGETQTLRVRAGQRITPQMQGEQTLRWRTGEAEGLLTEPTWEVRADQGVVLLTATEGEAFAALLLIPDSEGETLD